ncbi:MAG: cobalt-precorrin-6A reductase [Micromonosporaceae bacterium]|nr:cobalt-precorrin-6A reductase [Micromonosporaceae bacterium]
MLGGTAEARTLAAALAQRPDVECVSSLAGRVSRPRLPVGKVRVGGFGGPGGLTEWLRDNHMTALVDATHPYAEGIRGSALAAAPLAGVAYLRLERPGWTAGPGDQWHRVAGYAAAATTMAALGRRVFLTIGRQHLHAFTGLPECWLLARVVEEPGPVPRHVTVLRSRGPYTVGGETAVLREHRIDVLVTKDSGGSLTAPKLAAARALSVPVVMVDRPAPPPELAGQDVVHDVIAALRWVDRLARTGPGSRAGSTRPPPRRHAGGPGSGSTR